VGPRCLPRQVGLGLALARCWKQVAIFDSLPGAREAWEDLLVRLLDAERLSGRDSSLVAGKDLHMTGKLGTADPVGSVDTTEHLRSFYSC
jgi:hypothetical protein